MKSTALMLALSLNLIAGTALAADRPPREDSIKRLMAITESRKLVEGMMSQLDGVMKTTMKQATAGQPLNPAQEAVMMDMQGKLVAAMKEELAWEKLEPMYVEIYQKTFTQKEVDDMLTFYKSPSGQALIKKMPLVLQSSMQMTQSRIGALFPKIQQISQDAAERMKQAAEEHGGE